MELSAIVLEVLIAGLTSLAEILEPESLDLVAAGSSQTTIFIFQFRYRYRYIDLATLLALYC